MSRRGQRHSTQQVTSLDLFAREFDSEDKLRKALAELFRKMGHQGVRITHGANEKGKDIVFSARGPMGESRLFACVVKNAPITGQVDDVRHGAPTIVHNLQAVINQIQAAFDEPLTSGDGSDMRVDTAYIISPYECATTTIDSVKHHLQRSGQITFMCGQALLQLFAEHWPEFLWFLTTVLTDYLSALRKNLDEDYALANLILQKAPLENIPGLTQVYVAPSFHRVLKTRQRVSLIAPNLALLSGASKKKEIEEHARIARAVGQIVDTAPLWSTLPVNATAENLAVTSKAMNDLWEEAYKRHLVSRVSGRMSAPDEHDVRISIDPSPAFVEQATQLSVQVSTLLNDLQENAEKANGFAVSGQEGLAALRSEMFITYGHISDTARLVPFAFKTPATIRALEFNETLIDDFEEALLITAPAGYGKTSFCRWHAIHDAGRLVEKKSTILPVYVALHTLASIPLKALDDAFLPSQEVRKLLKMPHEQRGFSRIRLYLDGLDEVPYVERQREIVEMAEHAARTWTSLQVIITGRDHVIGPWLRWLRRVRLSPLTDDKVARLAQKWLEPALVEPFFAKLKEAGALRDLMRTPLLATLILAVYRKTGNIPPSKTTLYATFADLLCGGWDFYKNVQRRERSFGINDKTAILTRLASILQLQQRRDATEANFRTAVKETLPAFNATYERLLEEILEDGLLTQTGDMLTFSHLSFQEYLAARSLHGPAINRPQQAITRFFKGDDWWREVLAYYVTMTDRPAEMAEWIAKRASASTSTVVDLYERALFLKESLLVAFPGYQEHKGASQLYAQLQRKAERTASRNK